MGGSPVDGISLSVTSTGLLHALRDSGNAALWQRFDQRWRPVVFTFASRLGLGREAAAEAAQASLVRFFEAYSSGKYIPSRGRLSSWLMTISRNEIALMYRKDGSQPATIGDLAGRYTDDRDPPHEEVIEETWEREDRRALIQAAMVEIRVHAKFAPRTLDAFEMTALRGMSTSAVASELGMSAPEVFVARHRVTKRLKSEVERLAQESDALERKLIHSAAGGLGTAHRPDRLT
jgi:RNA polymerase sigma-70 factor, ECF subfamily